jgi:hypothetical protein
VNCFSPPGESFTISSAIGGAGALEALERQSILTAEHNHQRIHVRIYEKPGVDRRTDLRHALVPHRSPRT